MDRMQSEAIAQAITEAFKAKDADAFVAQYADDIVVWHNNDRQDQDKTENHAFLKGILEMFDSIEYTSIKRDFLDDGIMQQHIVHGVLADGRELELPACLIIRIRHGKICRIDEYSDPAPFHALMGS